MPHYDTDDDDDIGDVDLDDSFDRDWDHQPLWQTLLPIIAALIVGGIAGTFLGAQFFGSAKAAGNVTNEACLVLASDLYHQGENIEVVQEHLTALGYNNAAPTLLKMADDYAADGEPHKKQQSNELRQLAEGLLALAGKTPTPSVLVSTPQPSPTVGKPTASPTGVKTPAPTASTAPPTTTQPTATRPPSSPVAGTKLGRTTSSDHSGAKMRKSPTTDSNIVAYMNDGTKVEILEIVNGEAIDPAEPRWYHVKYGDLTGYIYFKLIVPGE